MMCLRCRMLQVALGCGFLSACGGSGCIPSPPAGNLEVSLQAVATGLTSPVALMHAGDGTGRLFIVDQIGVIRLLDADGTLRTAPFLDLRSRMISLDPTYDERGLLGLAFHPEYAANGRFFVYYSPAIGGSTRLSEFQVSSDPAFANAATERVLLELTQPQDNHNGGQLVFGPDGFLYLGTGDGGGADDQGPGHTANLGNAQDKTTLLGKILRLDVDTPSATIAVPIDNPLVNEPGARDEIFAYGLRNPWRFSFDTNQGVTRLFVADVGQNEREEVNLVRAGDNLGWYLREGDRCFDPDHLVTADCTRGVDGSTLVEPIVHYGHAAATGKISGLAVVGGFVYRGGAIPGLSGRYVFGDWNSSFFPAAGASGKLLVATESAGVWKLQELRVSGAGSGRIDRNVLGFGQDAAGELYVLTSRNIGPSGQTGAAFKLLPAGM